MSKNSDLRKPRRLGRGLSSLINSEPGSDGADNLTNYEHIGGVPPRADGVASPGGMLASIPLGSVRPSKHQPRRHFDEGKLGELAASMRAHGVLQPIVVRATAVGEYELIAGERRWRAAKLAGLGEIPAIVRVLDDRASAEVAIVENLQREDLSPMERAHAFAALADQFGLSHQDVASRVGVERTTVTNALRLLELEGEIAEMIERGELTQGHAKALLSLQAGPERRRMAQLCTREGWSVRETERRCAEDRPSARSRRAAPSSGEIIRVDLERRLSSSLGTKVEVKTSHGGTRGRIVVSFFDLAQLDGLLERLQVDRDK